MKRQRRDRGEAATPRHAPGSVRHAEKRRTGTCRFADRVAQVSLEAYRACVPHSFQELQKQTCLATIVAHFPSGNEEQGHLQVMALGVGTKFLPEKMLRAEEQNRFLEHGKKNELSDRSEPKEGLETENREGVVGQGYGMRVRDLHAEILARRAFRRQLCLEIQQDLKQRHNNKINSTGVGCYSNEKSVLNEAPSSSSSYRAILQQKQVTPSSSLNDNDSIQYGLLPGVTLHMYTSSAPCGNATLKKFTKMTRETFNDRLGPDEWPSNSHEPIPGHSLRLGQFVLLVKKDNNNNDTSKKTNCSSKMVDVGSSTVNTRVQISTSPTTIVEPRAVQNISTTKGKKWPANQNDDWCPPGTSIVRFNKGSLHTCSDKICRWNCLGLQGSLLAALLDSPLYMSSLTVGRKLTGCICRRAVCCRATPPSNFKNKQPTTKSTTRYALNHPAIMGTAVYMDESGVLDMSDSIEFGQDVRFTSSLCWAWWASIGTEDDREERDNRNQAECIDGDTGFAHEFGSTAQSHKTDHAVSRVSTDALLGLFCDIAASLPQNNKVEDDLEAKKHKSSLASLRSFKRQVSPEYEAAKDDLMTKHRIFRQWRRREKEGDVNQHGHE